MSADAKICYIYNRGADRKMQEENEKRRELEREIAQLMKKATRDQLDLVWRFLKRMLQT